MLDLQTILKDAHVCVLLTCDISPYRERRLKNDHIYRTIQDSGFVFFYLVCDISNTNIISVTHDKENDRYTLTLPLLETYTNLPRKMECCYSFFSKFDTKGILKLDDDVYKLDMSILQIENFNCDYTGAKMTQVGSRYLSNRDKPDTSELIFIEIKKPINYFSGGMYWLSKRALDFIVTIQLKYPWEDANVGYAMAQMPGCKIVFTDWFEEGLVTWTP